MLGSATADTSATIRLLQPVSCLPARLGGVPAAPTARPTVGVARGAPHALHPPAGAAAGLGEAGPAHGGHVVRGGRVLDAVAAVAGAGEDRHPRVVEVLAVSGGVGRVLGAAVAVADSPGAPRLTAGVHRVPEVRHAGVSSPPPGGSGSCGQAALTMSRSSAISSGPALSPRARVAAATALVDLLEAPVRRGARRQPVVASDRCPGRLSALGSSCASTMATVMPRSPPEVSRRRRSAGPPGP